MTIVNPDSIAGITSVTSSGTTLQFYDVNGNLLDVSANLTGELTVGTGATISSPAANVIDFETNGSERLRIGSSGQLGIAGANFGSSGQVITSGGSGSSVSWATPTVTTINNNATTKFITGTNTANTLDCEANLSYNNSVVTFASSNLVVDKSASPTISAKETSGNKEVQLRANTDGGLLRTVGTYPLVLGTNQAERLRITSTGALLVGTTSPFYGSGDMQHEIKKDNSRTYTASVMTGHSHLLLNNSDTTTNAFCGLGIRAGSADGAIGYVYTGSANSADFVINTDGGSNGVERLRIKSSGGGVHIGNTFSAHSEGDDLVVGGSGWRGMTIYGEGGGGVIQFADDGSNRAGQILYDHSTNHMHFRTNGNTTRFKIGSDGTSTATGTSDGVLQLDTSDSRGAFIRFGQNGSYHHMVGCGDGLVGGAGANDLGLRAADQIYFCSNGGNERMRLANNGTLFHGASASTSYGTNAGIILSNYTDGANNVTPGTFICSTTDIALIANLSDSNDGIVAVWRKGGSSKGSVQISGNSTSYNTSSDYRLKENNVAISDGISRLKTLRPYRFNWKSDPGKTIDGFFAHEVTPAVPEAVVGEKDAAPGECGMGYQSMDHSKLVPLLTAALQEAIVKIETLETEVTTLKSEAADDTAYESKIDKLIDYFKL